MSSFLHVITLTVSAVVLSAVPAPAQSRAQDRTWTLTPFLHSSADIEGPLLADAMGFGLAVACDLTPALGIEAEFSRLMDVAGSTTAVNWSISNFSANAAYHVDLSHVIPYATLGLGFARNSRSLKGSRIVDPALRNELLALGLDPDARVFDASSTEVAFNVGGGVKYAINNRIVARADLRRVQSTDIAPNYWRLYGGMTFVLR